jgi:hypothetical protein
MKLFQSQMARPNSILYNRWLLYFVMFVAIGNLFMGLMGGHYLFVAYFVLIGFVLSFFSKNMTVILVLAVALSNVLRVVFVGTALEGMDGIKGVEGMEDMNKADEKKNESIDEKKDTKQASEKKSELVESLKGDAKELMTAQKSIIQGFQEIEPYMAKAETLIESIDETTKKLKEVNATTIPK